MFFHEIQPNIQELPPSRQWLYQEENQKLYIPVMGADELFIVEVEYTFPPKA